METPFAVRLLKRDSVELPAERQADLPGLPANALCYLTRRKWSGKVLKKSGRFCKGVRPRRRTSEYLLPPMEMEIVELRGRAYNDGGDRPPWWWSTVRGAGLPFPAQEFCAMSEASTTNVQSLIERMNAGDFSARGTP